MTSEPKKIPLSERPIWQQINWPQTILLVLTPAIALYGICTTPLQAKTLIWAMVYMVTAALGTTAGYHRLYAHCSYKASFLFELIIMAVGTAAVQGSVLWWCRDHRVHHRFTDTDKDPYNAKRGFIWSHIGWMIYKKDSSVLGRAEVDDLLNNKLVIFQNNNYVPLALFLGFLFPTLVAGVGWGDWQGGYYYAAMTRVVIGHHLTFCINSLAHWVGDASYDDKLSPRDCLLTALLTMGEGYHNFHHQFPQDYRNAVGFYQYDPTKWFIYGLSKLGLTYDLKTFSKNEIEKGALLMNEKKLEKVRETIDWGVNIDSLPVFTMDQYVNECKENGKQWILIDSIIHNIEDFMNDHPGGIKYIRSYIGRDATASFNGDVYDHSNAARNLMSSMRVGRLL